jgi:hypothetical protein
MNQKMKMFILNFILKSFNYHHLCMRITVRLFLSFCLGLSLWSCNKDFYPVGVSLLQDQTLELTTNRFDVFTFQEGLDKVQSNNLPLIQLGSIEHPVFGKSQASFVSQLVLSESTTFGNYSQELEDEQNQDQISIIPENETVTAVYLEIPFFNNLNDRDNDGVIDSLDADPDDPQSNSDSDELSDLLETQAGLNPLSSDSDGDGILDHNDDENDAYEEENKVYQIDSIYGNPNASFDLKVYESTYYLNALDPTKNFESRQVYYSSDDYFEKGFYNEVLFEDRINLNFEELRFNYKEDDPDTEDIDETTRVETRLSPRIRVALDTDFFQRRLIDMEGSPSLASSAAFQEAMRGIIVRTENFSDDIYMLLDIQNAVVKVEYEFDQYSTNGTSDEIADDRIDKIQREYTLGLSGIRINTLKNEGFNASIQEGIISSNQNLPSDRLYIKSGKYHGKIRLFSNENSEGKEVLNNLRQQNWLISKAKLEFYLDSDQTEISAELLAQRLYLYEYESGSPLLDYFGDNSISSSGTNRNKNIFGGLLEYDESNKPYKYSFNLTKHISNIIRNDSLNLDLGLVVSANIEDNSIIEGIKNFSDDPIIKYPRAATLNPIGSVLVGSHPADELSDKKVVLEITYSSY